MRSHSGPDTLTVARDILAEAALNQARLLTERQTEEMVARARGWKVCTLCRGECRVNNSWRNDPQMEYDCPRCGGDGYEPV